MNKVTQDLKKEIVLPLLGAWLFLSLCKHLELRCAVNLPASSQCTRREGPPDHETLRTERPSCCDAKYILHKPVPRSQQDMLILKRKYLKFKVVTIYVNSCYTRVPADIVIILSVDVFKIKICFVMAAMANFIMNCSIVELPQCVSLFK